MFDRAQFGRLVNRARDLLFLPGTERFWRARLKGKVMALVYHRVDDPSNHAFLARGGVPVIAPELLERELTMLRRFGARFLTFADLRRGAFPEADEFGVIVTFDDCFLDNYTQGLEVLDSVGIKGVFFQCSGMIGARRLIPEHALYWLSEQPETAPQLLEMARMARWPGAQGVEVESLRALLVGWVCSVPAPDFSCRLQEFRDCQIIEEPVEDIYPTVDDVIMAYKSGHEIGSHGHSHLHRFTLDASAFEQELFLSSGRLKEITGMRPAAFSYPFNGYRAGDRELCGKYFKQAVTVDRAFISRDSDRLNLSRFSWPGPARNALRMRRWLFRGSV